MLYGMGAGVAREVEATAPQEAPDKCRTSAAEALRLGVITGILVWQDFLCQGPIGVDVGAHAHQP